MALKMGNFWNSVMTATKSNEMWNEIAILQISSGTASLIASCAIVGFILCKGRNGNGNGGSRRSNSNSNTISPYQHLVLGLSIFDILKSIATIIGPFTLPSADDNPAARWAIGNRYTCRFDAFLFCVGSNGVQMYTLGLCIYYVYKLNKKMSDEVFARRVGKKMHVLISVFNIGIYTVALFLNVLNGSPAGTVCYPSAYPSGCRTDPGLDCDALSERSYVFFFMMNSMLVPLLCFGGICVCMAKLIWHALRQEQIFGPSTRLILHHGRGGGAATGRSFSSRLRAGRLTRVPADPAGPAGLADGATTGNADLEVLSRLYKRELIIQAISYLLMFCMTSIPFATLHLFCVVGSKVCSSKTMIRLNSITFPLAGLLHILVYTRPKAAYVRRRRPDISRLGAFWLVLKSGGNVPDNLDDIHHHQRHQQQHPSSLLSECCYFCCCCHCWPPEDEGNSRHGHGRDDNAGGSSNRREQTSNNFGSDQAVRHSSILQGSSVSQVQFDIAPPFTTLWIGHNRASF